MNITVIIWLQNIAEKIERKHNLSKDEVEQTFINDPHYRFLEKGKIIDAIPDDMTIEEASEFWDNHSVADYPSRMVRIEYNPEGKVTFIAISNELLKTLDQKAKKEGISVETLVNLWIQEKLISA
ncbi:hypothetical protein HY02_01010 [Peptococcaceae bacterium SCADC1_2_3]|nr:hypothetical protein DK28_0203250 [Peptococcaceae bacterium SCADC1_2_3]KFI34968.1 hypothetical protein HY00_08200 [Peptococcaceae bacterium SCADC1_2_3]KFI36670.1 hypothetical protein HY02_01010 [Peptococcaceae bacterium SCADC1_2_3]